MQLVNATKMQAGYTMGLQPDGRELLVVVVKGAFTIPQNPNDVPVLAEEQVPLVMTDEFTGEPGLTALKNENDFAPRKPRCDVLLTGSAYAPHGRPTERVTVSLRVGTLTKSFDVVGKRVWQAGFLGCSVSEVEPFTVMPISYDNAFGGVDRSQEDPSKHRFCPNNFAGVGYHENKSAKYLDGKPMPNTEETGRSISNPSGKYKPMAFGPIGRAWEQRVKLAGTYDKKWLDTKHPFLPDDFQDAYYQAAPVDQQIEYPQGGEEVQLLNLTLRGQTAFKLPTMVVPFEFVYRNGERKKSAGVIDTLLLEPDLGRFMMCSRVCWPLRRNMDEIRYVTAGPLPREWYAAHGVETRSAEKRRFSSLADLAAAKR